VGAWRRPRFTAVPVDYIQDDYIGLQELRVRLKTRPICITFQILKVSIAKHFVMLISTCVIYRAGYFQLIVYKKDNSTGHQISLGLLSYHGP